MDARGEKRKKQHVTKRVEKCSNRRRKEKRYQENIQNFKRSVARHWNKESKYI